MFNKRTIAILFLSFSSGLPLALSGSTLQAWYTVAGVPIMTIGALTLVGQPYVYKFLWAPLLDRFVPFKMERRRGWIFIMQFLIMLVLVAMSFANPSKTPWFLALLALGLAIFSASQDIAFDAYRTDILKAKERGMGASFNAIGYRMAMMVSSAIALILAGEIGWRQTYLIMAGIMLIAMFVTLASPKMQKDSPPRTLKKAVLEPWKDFLTRQNAIIILVFVVIYKLTDAFALSLNTYFLIKGVGFTLIEIGTVSKMALLIGGLAGGFIGGVTLPRLGLYRALMWFGFLQMASNLPFILLILVSKSLTLAGFIMFIEAFCSGMGTVAFVVLLMSLCNKTYTATQFALLSALSAIGRVYVGPQAAFIVKHFGWVDFYVVTFLIGLPSLLILWWLNRRIDFRAEQLAQVSN